jgi:hypothetical protein
MPEEFANTLRHRILQARNFRRTSDGSAEEITTSFVAQSGENAFQYLPFTLAELILSSLTAFGLYRLHQPLDAPLIDPGLTCDHVMHGVDQQVIEGIRRSALPKGNAGTG